MDNIDAVGACIHQVDLCKHSNRSVAVGINFASQLEGIRVGQILVSWGDCHDDRSLWKYIIVAKLLNLLFNIRWLVSCCDLCHAWQVHEREVNYRARKDFQDDWFG